MLDEEEEVGGEGEDEDDADENDEEVYDEDDPSAYVGLFQPHSGRSCAFIFFSPWWNVM